MRIEEFRQTPFVSHEDKNLVYARVGDWDLCNAYSVQVVVGQQLLCEKKVFAPEFSLMLPVYREETDCTIRILPFEDMPVEESFVLKPPKHWQISLIYSAHEDLGYCGYIEKLPHELYEALKKAMELCREHKDFRYMIEHYWWLDSFDRYASEEEKAQLRELIRTGRIELNAIHSGVHTSWGNAEQLVRELYFSCFDARRKYGAEPKCCIYSDISGISWPAVQARAEMGIRYMGILANSWRCGEENKALPPIFWWGDKSGKNKVLFWYQRSYRAYGLAEIWCDTQRQYAEGEFFFDTGKALKTEKWFAEKLSALGDCGYDVLPLSFYDDREIPGTMLLTICEEMNRRWKSPVFRMDTPSAALEKVAQSGGDRIPLLRGDITDQWADFATIAPAWLAQKRENMRRLYDAEALAVLRSITDGAPYPRSTFARVLWGLCCFDEHCWATSSKHPQKMHRSNLEQVKKRPVMEGAALLQQEMTRLCAAPAEDYMSIISTLPVRRHNGLRVQAGSPVPAGMVHQILPDGSVVTEPIAFDGIGCRVLEAVTPTSPSVPICADRIETDHYIIRLNRNTQKLLGITDKQTGRELLDRTSRFELGQFLYLYSEDKLQPATGYEIPKKISFELYEGPLAYVLVQTGHEEQSGAQTHSQFLFYKHEKNIDIALGYRNAAGLLGDYYDRYKKNYFFAFPFDLKAPEFFTELQAGDRNEATEVLPLNARDFTVTQNWVAAEEPAFGIAIHSADMPVFHLGSIKYNHFGKQFHEERGHFFLYASSNRCNNLLYTSPEECCAEYRLSILPYSGSHAAIVPAWSAEKEHTLLTGGADTETGFGASTGASAAVRLDRHNVRLVSMKKAEECSDAIVLRFTEAEGCTTPCRLELFFTPSKAAYVSGDERELSPAAVEGNAVCFTAGAHSYTTLKIYGDFHIREE